MLFTYLIIIINIIFLIYMFTQNPETSDGEKWHF